MNTTRNAIVLIILIGIAATLAVKARMYNESTMPVAVGATVQGEAFTNPLNEVFTFPKQ